MNPRVTVVVPCHNEEGYADRLLDGLLSQIGPGWSVVAVDDSSTDATPSVLAALASGNEALTVVTGRYGSPGGARSAGVAAACAVANPPTWIVTVDADVDLDVNWFRDWDAALLEVDGNESIGAVNGVEVQDHLFAAFPNAAKVSAAFGLGIGASETAIGITNLNGVNHAVRVSAYLTSGPYLQPTAPGPHGTENLAGEDWDLGVRLRLAGYSVAETQAKVHDRGRRLLADLHAYVSGEAYEGAFQRITGTAESHDVAEQELRALIDSAVARSLRHFFLKPILSGAVPLEKAGLTNATVDAMRLWMERWPYPSFTESRNGFIFGRLERFADAFIPSVRSELGLAPADLARNGF